MAKISLHRSGEHRDDPQLRERAGGCDGGAAETREVVAIGAGDTFDDSESTKAAKLPRQGCRGEIRQQADQVSAAHAMDVELGTLQGSEQVLFGALEEVQSLDRAVGISILLGQAIQCPNAVAMSLDGGEELQVPAIASEEDLAQIDEAVYRLLQRGEVASGAAFAVFHLAVVLEKGHVVDGGLDAQHEADLVVHLHLRLSQAMLDAGALDAGLQARAELLRQLWSDLLAEEGGHLVSLDGQHRLARELLIERGQGLARAKHQIRGVLSLHEAPVIALAEGLLDRAAQAGVASEHPVQLLGLEGVGELLGRLPILQPHEGVVGEGRVNALGAQLLRQPPVTVAVELQPKWTPRRHPQIAEAYYWVHEVEVVVQTLAAVGLEEGLVACLVVPGLVALAGLHRRDHVHQPRVIPAPLQDFRHDILLADMLLADVLDLDAGRGSQLLGSFADRLPQRLGKPGVVENADPPAREKPRHPLRVARLRQCARYHP